MNGDVLVKATVWVMSLVLALVFVSVGVGKIAGADAHIAHYQSWGIPSWALLALGVLEVTGGVFLLIPRWALIGAFILSLELAASAMMHFSLDENHLVMRALVLLFMLLGISYLRVKRMPENGLN
ncbi:DoxX family protein [Emcibacter sp.]|uniref:DoxX family protein n=1 Tax=Emcibacter sp. TaxID=1979954 RepID=UPI002AA95C9A|nr:DoxX family protein [Emcibacter sp.]